LFFASLLLGSAIYRQQVTTFSTLAGVGIGFFRFADTVFRWQQATEKGSDFCEFRLPSAIADRQKIEKKKPSQIRYNAFPVERRWLDGLVLVHGVTLATSLRKTLPEPPLQPATRVSQFSRTAVPKPGIVLD
jgi:hypothetical protein